MAHKGQMALAKNPNWRGGISDGRSDGYRDILMPGHHRAHGHGYVFEHTLIAEKALGKPLPRAAVVHHHTPKQIVICQDQAYHNLLHQRTRAYKDCGHASWRKCPYCKEYSDPSNMVRHSRSSLVHDDCRKAHLRIWRANHKAQRSQYAKVNRERINENQRVRRRGAEIAATNI